VEKKVYLGQNIRDLRKAMGMTQQQLADLSGVDRREISRIETGVSFYPQDIGAISRTLDISPKFLITGGVFPTAVV
jgi:transcriptional regulator with XRE-family HTH domain